MEIARDPYSRASLGLIYAKKTPSKISRLGTFKQKILKKLYSWRSVFFIFFASGLSSYSDVFLTYYAKCTKNLNMQVI